MRYKLIRNRKEDLWFDGFNSRQAVWRSEHAMFIQEFDVETVLTDINLYDGIERKWLEVHTVEVTP